MLAISTIIERPIPQKEAEGEVEDKQFLCWGSFNITQQYHTANSPQIFK